MRENNLMVLALLGVIIGASGLGFGAYSTMQVQTGAVSGDDGDDGDDGIVGEKGKDAPGDIIVGILEPHDGEIVSGNTTIRAIVAGSDIYSVKVLINGSLNATYVPFTWNSSKVSDGWWNITLIVTDVASNNIASDQVIIYVDNNPTPTTPTTRAKIIVPSGQNIGAGILERVAFTTIIYNVGGCVDMSFGVYIFRIREDGYYYFTLSIKFISGDYVQVWIFDSSRGDDPISDNNAHIAQGFAAGTGIPYSVVMSDICWFDQSTELEVWVYSPTSVLNIDGGVDETYFAIEKLPY